MPQRLLNQALTNVTFVNATQTPLKNISGLVTFDLDNLAKGQTKTVDVIVTPNQAGEISTTASVGAKEIDSDNSNNTVTETTDVLVDAEPDLAVTISESSDPVKLGENLTYTLTVTNNGVGNATEVALTQTLKNVTLVSTSLPYVKNKDGDLTFDLDNLAKGETKTVDIVVSPNQAGGISNTARVKAKEIDSDNNNNTVTEITSVQDIILDPLQVSGDFKFNKTTKRYEESGTIQIGLKGEPFQLAVVGSMSYDKNTIKAEGIVSSNIGNLTEPLFKGKFEIPVGEASTSSLIETEPLVGEFKLAGLDSTFNGLNFALGKIGLEGTFLLPDELGGSSVQMSVPNTLIISNDGVSAGGGKFSFPNSKFKLKELIGVESTDLAIEYLPTPEDALKLQGKLSLEPFVKSVSPQIIADFSGDNFLQVGKNGVDVKGALSVKNIPIVPKRWEIKEAKLTLDTIGKEVKGEGTMLIPLGIEIGGSLGFIYKPDWALNSLSITADNMQEPIPVFPLAFVQRISGKVEHLAKSDPKPLEAAVGIGLTIGPRIQNFPLPQWLGGDKGEYALVDVGLDGTLKAENLTGQRPNKISA